MKFVIRNILFCLCSIFMFGCASTTIYHLGYEEPNRDDLILLQESPNIQIKAINGINVEEEGSLFSLTKGQQDIVCYVKDYNESHDKSGQLGILGSALVNAAIDSPKYFISKEMNVSFMAVDNGYYDLLEYHTVAGKRAINENVWVEDARTGDIIAGQKVEGKKSKPRKLLTEEKIQKIKEKGEIIYFSDEEDISE